MITTFMMGKIRRMHFRDGMSVREVARRTGLALYRELCATGYRGGYSRVTDCIRGWRQDGGGQPRACVPLRFEWGEAFQFDWSTENLVVGGIPYQAQVAHLKLCASRAFWLVAYPSQEHEMLFDAHARSFLVPSRS